MLNGYIGTVASNDFISPRALLPTKIPPPEYCNCYQTELFHLDILQSNIQEQNIQIQNHGTASKRFLTEKRVERNVETR